MAEHPEKYENAIAGIKVKCKCSHVLVFPVFRDKLICNYCHNAVYRTPKIEFEYKLKEAMKKKRKEEKNEN